MKMTDRDIAALMAEPGKRIEQSVDPSVGLWVRASSTSKVWYCMGRVPHGRWVRVKLGRVDLMPLAKARVAAKVALGRIVGGEDPRAARRAQSARKLTVRAALEDYLKVHDQRHKPSYQADCRRMLDAELAKLADRSVADLDGEQVLRWFKGQASVAVAAKAARVLRAVLRHADKRHGVRGRDGKVATEIIGDLRMWPKAERRRTTLGQPADWLDALNRVPGAVADLFKCLAYHGLRRDELRTLTWEHVDLQQGTIHLPDPKGRRPQLVPLVTQTRAIIEQRAAEDPHRQPGDAVFSTDVPRPAPRSRKGTKSRRGLPVEHGRPIGTSTLQRWVGRVGETTAPWAMHDLRRSFISKAVDLGVSSYVIKKLVHHADGNDVTAGYVSLDVERLRQHAQQVADALFRLPAQVIAFPSPSLPDKLLVQQSRPDKAPYIGRRRARPGNRSAEPSERDYHLARMVAGALQYELTWKSAVWLAAESYNRQAKALGFPTVSEATVARSYGRRKEMPVDPEPFEVIERAVKELAPKLLSRLRRGSTEEGPAQRAYPLS